MAGKTAILKVDIIADAAKVKKGTDEAEGHLSKFQASMKKLAVPAALIGAGLLAIGRDMGKMASEAEQNFGAVDAVFKGHAQSVKDLAKNSATNLGLSGSDYAKYSALLGSQLKNAGVPLEQLAGKTDKLIGYGADFAAQFGGDVPTAVEALSSALKGEMDPLEKYGITLNDAAIKAELSRTGMDKLTGAAGSQAKAQAIMNLIQGQGADALGAFGREAGTAAGAQAIATAKWEDASAQLGTVLLPLMTQAATIFADFAKWVTENQQLVTTLAVVLGILAGAILAINVVMAVMNAIAAVNPFVLLGIAVAALIGFIIYLATQTTVFQDIWTAVAKFCADVWNGFVGFITGVWNGFMGFINGAIGNVGKFFTTIFGNIGNFIGTVARNIGNFFSNAFNGARSVVNSVVSSIISFFSTLGSIAGNILFNVYSFFANAFNNARNVVAGVINFIVGGFNNVVNAVSNVISWVSRLFNGFGVPDWMRQVMNFMGMGGTGIEMNASFLPALAGLPDGMGATGFMLPAASLGGSSGGTTHITNVEITVQGAIDPIGTARQIKQIINSDALRNGTITAGGSIW